MVCIVDVDVDVNDEGIDFGVQPQSLSCWKKVSELKEEKKLRFDSLLFFMQPTKSTKATKSYHGHSN